MTFILVIIAVPLLFVQGAYNTIFDGFPIPFSDHVGKVVEVAPIANTQKIKTLGEWEEEYSKLYIGENVVYAKSREDADFKKITTFQKYEVTREKLKTGRVLSNRSYRICILKNSNNQTEYIRENCESIDEINPATEKYKSILQSIKEGKVYYFAKRDVHPNSEFRHINPMPGLKQSFTINDYNIYELKDENQLYELIKLISKEDDNPKYIKLNKLNDLIYLSQDDLKNDKVLSKLMFLNILNKKLVTKKEEIEKIESGDSISKEQENFVEEISDFNEKIAIRMYFNYFNQYFKKNEKLGSGELTYAFKGLEEIRKCLIWAEYFTDKNSGSNILKNADNILFNTPELQDKYSFFLKNRMSYTIDNVFDCHNFHKFREIQER